MEKPNLVVPLASSYDERGIAAFTTIVTNSIDQRKVNCFYEIDHTAKKLNLAKRPGVCVSSLDPNNYGDSAQVAYLATEIPNSVLGDKPWVFSKLGNDIRVSDASLGSAATVLFSSASVYIPCYVDHTLIGTQDMVVVQAVANTSLSHRTFFSSAIAAFTEIVDADFTSLLHRGKMEHMDGFAFILDSANKIYNSDINTLVTWNPANFISKSIQQDYPRGLAKLKNQILAFGDETVEVFYNAGNATGSPLSPIKQLSNKIGLAVPASSPQISEICTHYYANYRDKIYFVGHAAGGFSTQGFFSYNGSIFEKISTPAIDKLLRSRDAQIYSVSLMGCAGQAAIALALDPPSLNTQRWLMFFPELNEWFEWNSTVFCPFSSSGYHIGSLGNGHKIYFFQSNDNWQDGTSNPAGSAGVSFTMQTQFKLPQDGHHRKRMAEFGVLGDTARSSNQLLVEFSDDDFQSFKTIGNIELAHDIKTLNRGGSYRQRAVRLSSTNALEVRLSSFIARIK